MTALTVRGLQVHHGQLHAVRDLDLELEQGEVLSVIGANGAGKTTLLRAVAGTIRPTAGVIELDGQDLTGVPAHRRVARGVAMVPEGRRLFASLSVEENLLTGTYRARRGPWTVEKVFDLFPWLAQRRRHRAAHLSGGEQQAVAIGRALVANPRVLLLDELSLGLAPVVVQQIYEVLPDVVAEGTAALVVEQDVTQAMAVADRVHCLLEGASVLRGRPEELTAQQVERAYFGIAGEDDASWNG